MRLDLWLFQARLFKSRSQATNACKEGKVFRSDRKLDPADQVAAGDLIDIREHGLYRSFRILELPGKNVSKEIAKTTYRDETSAEIIDRFKAMVMAKVPHRDSKSKPTKKDRRVLDKMRGR